jgi:hypothetical protein
MEDIKIEIGALYKGVTPKYRSITVKVLNKKREIVITDNGKYGIRAFLINFRKL